MAFIALFILLITYVIAYWKAMRRGFSRAGLNALVLSSGTLLMLLPLGIWGGWYFMMNDWPMNIGGDFPMKVGKPNWNWSVNKPSDAIRISAIVYGAVTLLALVLVSLMYGIIRMWVVHGRRKVA